MRVLLATHLPVDSSASGRNSGDLVHGLRQAGHQVVCLSVDDGRNVPEDHAVFRRVICRAGDPCADLPLPLPRFLDTGEPGGTTTFAHFRDEQIVQYVEHLRARLDQCVAQFDPHVIHCQELWLWSHLALESGVPYLMSVAGPELALAADEPRFFPFVQQAAENASRILCHDAAQVAAVRQTLEVPPDVLQVMPLPLDRRNFQPQADRQPLSALWSSRRMAPPEGPLVVLLADMQPSARPELLVNTAAALERAHPQLTCLLLGTGPLRAELESQMHYLGLTRCHGLGHPPAVQRAALFAAAELTLAAIGPTGEARLLLESLACGTPVLAVPRGGLGDLVHDAIGGRAADDHHLLAEQASTALQQNWKRSKGPAAEAWVAREFDLSATAARLAQTYQAVLDQRFGSLPWD